MEELKPRTVYQRHSRQGGEPRLMLFLPPEGAEPDAPLDPAHVEIIAEFYGEMKYIVGPVDLGTYPLLPAPSNLALAFIGRVRRRLSEALHARR